MKGLKKKEIKGVKYKRQHDKTPGGDGFINSFISNVKKKKKVSNSTTQVKQKKGEKIRFLNESWVSTFTVKTGCSLNL